jgi:aspartyl-tRNA(Asn)/glutamyl-tRNA(Gln) amidotransferase subunit B
MSAPASHSVSGVRRSGFEVVVGLEVHLALRTHSKLFCACPTNAGDSPNQNLCPVCMGLPGSLPVLNRGALTLAVRFASALGCAVPPVTVFARKHYGYPDSPKNYQLSQHALPVGLGGSLTLPDGKVVAIVRCHLEEDAGRLIHPTYADHSLVDLDRAGTPLIELVTEPCLHSGDEAKAFLEEVRALARALDVSDATPEEGRMRADVNISLRRPGEGLGTKVEVKNLNSFKSVQAAIESEAVRQERLLQAGRSVTQETRGWNEGGQKSFVMRSKEEAADYRYLSDPDLPPVRLRDAWLSEVRAQTPATPAALRERYQRAGVRPEDADRLATDVDLQRAFDALVAAAPQQPAQSLANWLLVEVVGWANSQGLAIESLQLTTAPAAARLAALIALVADGAINAPTGKGLLGEVLQGADARTLIDARGLQQVSDSDALARWVDTVMAAHPAVVAQARSEPKAVNFLMGQVMRESGGQARPDAVRALLQARLYDDAK